MAPWRLARTTSNGFEMVAAAMVDKEPASMLASGGVVPELIDGFAGIVGVYGHGAGCDVPGYSNVTICDCPIAAGVVIPFRASHDTIVALECGHGSRF